MSFQGSNTPLSPTLFRFARYYALFVSICLFSLGVLREQSNSGTLFRHFGTFSITFMFTGLILAAFAWKSRSEASRTRLLTFSVCLTFIYLALFVLNITIERVRESRAWEGNLSWRSLYESGGTGFRRKLLPNLNRNFYYAGERISLRTNSEGYRDDEFSFRPGQRNIVMDGDSYTFGFGIDQEEKLDRQLEKLGEKSGPGLNVYNISKVGACAYNVRNDFLDFRDPNLTDYVYVFHGNDISDLSGVKTETTTYKNILFEKYKVDGTPFSEQEYDEILEQLHANVLWISFGTKATGFRRLADLATFSLVRKAVGLKPVVDWGKNIVAQFREKERNSPIEKRIAEGAQGKLPECNRLAEVANEKRAGLAHTLSLVEEMSKTARDRNVGFHVAMTPSPAEVDAGAYHPEVAAFICVLKKKKISVLGEEALLYLRKKDFIPGDWHYNARGAGIVGEAIFRSLSATQNAGL